MNMKKILITILILALCILFAGCAERDEDERRVYYVCEGITFVEVVVYDGVKQPYVILVHKETRVMYVKESEPYQGGMSVMLDENGNPLLWEGEL